MHGPLPRSTCPTDIAVHSRYHFSCSPSIQANAVLLAPPVEMAAREAASTRSCQYHRQHIHTCMEGQPPTFGSDNCDATTRVAKLARPHQRKLTSQ